MENYQVVLIGIQAGKSKTEVQAKLATLFKVTAKQVDSFVASGSYVVKKGVVLNEANKYKNAIEATGAACDILPMQKHSVQKENIWWYAKGSQKIGPHTVTELKGLVETGIIRPDDLVWKEGLDNWMPSSSFESLFPEATTTPPPLPPVETKVAHSAEKYLSSSGNFDDKNKENINQPKYLTTGVIMETTSKYLKLLFIFIYVIIFSALILPGQLKPIVTLICLPCMSYCSFYLAKSIDRNKWMWAVFVLIPLVNLLALLVLIRDCTKALKSSGYKIGFLGATKI